MRIYHTIQNYGNVAPSLMLKGGPGWVKIGPELIPPPPSLLAKRRGRLLFPKIK